MDIEPIKIPNPLVPSQFKVRAPTDVDERRLLKDFDAYCRFLEDCGFQRIAASRSLSHDTMKRGLSHGEAEDYQAWFHPVGVFLTIKSYTLGGWRRDDGQIEPVSKTVSSVSASAMVDVGMGAELQHRAAVKLSGSGGVEVLADGSRIRRISSSIHSNTQGSLVSFMNKIQRHGRLVPLCAWGVVPMFENELKLPSEIIAPVQRWTPGDALEVEDMDGKTRDFLAKLPHQLGPVFLDAHKRLLDQDYPDHTPEYLFSSRRFSECLFLAGKRWPKQAERRLLSHWVDVANGAMGDTLDPVAMRAYEPGPAGLSLATTLLYAFHSSPCAASLLAQLLNKAPIDVLRNWATAPDAAGYTLGLDIVARIFTDRAVDRYAPPMEPTAALEILHDRLGPGGIVLATPRRSIMGLALEDREYRIEEVEIQHADFARIIEKLDEWGVDWSTHLRWRNHPNLFASKDKPAFFSIDGPVDAAQWRHMMGSNWTRALDEVATRCERAHIDRGTKAPPPASRRVMRL